MQVIEQIFVQKSLFSKCARMLDPFISSESDLIPQTLWKTIQAWHFTIFTSHLQKTKRIKYPDHKKNCCPTYGNSPLNLSLLQGNIRWCLLSLKSHVGIHQTAYHANIQSKKVKPRKYIITTYQHS